MTLKEFVDKYHQKLIARLERDLKPVYKPGENTETPAKIVSLLRKPFPVQQEIVKGLTKAMFEMGRRKLFICGEMGTGKTTIANSIVHMAPRPMRVLVVSPPHLVEKWRREIKLTVPWAQTYDIAVKDVISKLSLLREAGKPNLPEFWVISKERAKLSYKWKPAYIKTRRSLWPRCSSCGKAAVGKDGEPVTEEQLKKKRHVCECGEPLWQADNSLKRFAPADFIKKYLKGLFDLVILDEIHEYKAGDSLQGQAMGKLVSCSKYFLGLTGTLNGGYADDLFYLLYRLEPKTLKGFGYHGVEEWQKSYGILEQIETIDEDDYVYGRGKKRNKIIKKKPGVSPEVIGKFFLDKTAFVRLADVVDSLPPYDEYVITVPMGQQAVEYGRLKDELKDAVIRYRKKAAAAMLQSLLCYPDSAPAKEEDIKIRNKEGDVICEINVPKIELPEGELLPKEKELIRIIGEEGKKGRKVLVYMVFTGTRDIRGRIMDICDKAGFRTGILPESVEPKKREKWINEHADRYDVLITNPELVKVGLDLVQFPTIIFFEVGYNISTLRQAARRSWRIGQKQPVGVYYLCYGETMQETALSLTAKKLEVALLIEGDMPEGLGQYGAGNSMGSMIEELTNALLEGKSYGGAERVWASMRKREIESALEIGAKETSFTDLTKGRNRGEKTTVSEDVVVRVSVKERGKRKTSRMSIRFGDIDTELKGKTVQFELF